MALALLVLMAGIGMIIRGMRFASLVARVLFFAVGLALLTSAIFLLLHH